MTEPTNKHGWRFFRAGGFDQVLLESGDDLKNLSSLDQKLWVALSCPVKGVYFNGRTLELIDSDSDGQIRVPELLAAIDWTAKRLKSLDILLSSPDRLKLSDVDVTSAEGQRILASARTILKNIGKEGEEEISLEDAIDSEKIFAGTGFNGDGVITALSTGDEWLQGWIETVGLAAGTAPDRCGERGITAEGLAWFSEQAGLWQQWRTAGKDALAGVELEKVDEICALWERLSPKIEDYFIRCRLAAFDCRGGDAMNSSEADLIALGARNLATATDDIAALPISLVTAATELDLVAGLNPAWEGEVNLFRELVILPLYGNRERLGYIDWNALKERITPLQTWWQNRTASAVTDIDPERLLEWHEKNVAGLLQELVANDLELSGEAEAIIEVETLLHYLRYLYTLLNNFVAFRDFYTRKGVGIFQCGTLFIDGRSCELCVPVKDTARHLPLATLSRLYLVYCDCVRRGGTEKMTIAAAITNGDSDQIIVGRNGLFYDQNGDDWDAVVVKVIDHPISLRQAFWSPYKRLSRIVGEQVQKMTAARSKANEDKVQVVVTKTLDGKTDAKPAAPAAPAPVAPPQQQLFDVGKFAGIFAAIGLAVGALGSAIATTITGFLKLQWWQMPLAPLGIILLVSGPSMIIAWFKLRQRNLGPILDANGWAINARARLNIPFGASLTSLPKLPEGSRQILTDPFAEKKKPWKSLLCVVVLLAAAIIFWLKR